MNGLTSNRGARLLRRLPAVATFAIVGLLTVAAVLVVTLLAVRSHGIAQLAIQTRDSAHALSVALRPFMPDASASEGEQLEQVRRRKILMRALAQSGNYRQLQIAGIDGNVGFTYENLPATAGVPRWFSSLVNIEAPKYRAEITVGWDIAGFIQVSRQPAPVYRMLWQCTQGILGTGLAGLILALILASVRARAVHEAVPSWALGRPGPDVPEISVTLPTEQVLQRAEARHKTADADHASVTVQRNTFAEQVSDE